MRHAKSSWKDATLADRQRPLADRGERAAATVGVWLRQQGLAPDLALCSPAERATATLEIVAHQLPRAPAVEVVEALYPGEPEAIASAVCERGQRHAHVLVIGHHPGLLGAALALAGPGGDDALAGRLREHFPTGAVARLELRAPWRRLAPGSARLAGFVVPKQLV